jgi:hypothetical protein
MTEFGTTWTLLMSEDTNLELGVNNSAITSLHDDNIIEPIT